MDEESKTRLSRLLVGLECVDVEQSGNFIQLVFRERRLIIGCAWRVSRDSEILVGSDSEDDLVDSLPQYLRGQCVDHVSVRGEFHDLRVEFMNHLILEAFADSEKYENWQLVGGANDMIIAGPSGLWSEF
jgi:hypothetical protein